MSQIIINRSDEWANRLRKYPIYINGEKAGSISNGGEETFSLSPGQHILKLRVDFLATPEISFTINENDTKHFQVKNNSKAHNKLIWVFLLIGIYPLLKATLPAAYSTSYIVIYFLFLLLYIYKSRGQYISFEEFQTTDNPKNGGASVSNPMINPVINDQPKLHQHVFRVRYILIVLRLIIIVSATIIQTKFHLSDFHYELSLVITLVLFSFLTYLISRYKVAGTKLFDRLSLVIIAVYAIATVMYFIAS